MDAEDLEITPTKGPSCAGVRALVMELLADHPLVTRVEEIREYGNDVGLKVEIGGLDFDVWVEPA
ncbi:hypothetical protein AB0O64_23290 [Streptomyces sp. NPDC088341]|uniref:hypothetical protein n=1 Tax=Streptomyces sp. NPDC088341 TaxID=3154870 RepID=UPI00342E5594